MQSCEWNPLRTLQFDPSVILRFDPLGLTILRPRATITA
jgi:hypothetical protein